ncbi:MAG: Hsp20/alpha crystallin family protein [Candidatus Paraimprobicoccus trichonymphae]|uniref:Hsp20/alpha crystallin family protein n=1 Tax=Candidatus Paraimprobicoccus trichonymphae TaxID=3033793 RepID=A0AA48KY39_9FIRM|nr:MAG: Hsp20/alpha crystallin family protein [Candidatus Paraimprobicoccus trichonymphae]
MSYLSPYNSDLDFFSEFKNILDNKMVATTEKDGYYLLRIEVPGYASNEINIELGKDDELKINAKTKEEDEKKERNFSIKLKNESNENLKSEDLEVHLENGILKIKYPKKSNLKINSNIVNIIQS